MIIVFKLLSGEEIIGKLDCETDEHFAELERYELISPMWVVSEKGGIMKLRDACMLSENKALIFYADMVITCYKPIKSLVKYYEAALAYATSTQDMIDKQIDAATEDLDAMNKDNEDYASQLTSMLLKVSGTKLH